MCQCTAHKAFLVPIPSNFHANTYAQGARTRLDLDSYSYQLDSHPIPRKSALNARRDKLPPVAGKNEVEDDNGVVLPFDDHYSNAVDDSASGSNEEEDQPG